MTTTTDLVEETIAKIREVDPRNRTPEQHKVIHAYHQVALEILYLDKGVGDTITHKLKFWESTCPNGYSISHNPSDEMRVRVFEASYLSDHFPEDQIFC